MGVQAQEAQKLTIDELETALREQHAIYMQVENDLYYLTDVNDNYWRVQRTDEKNEKGHYVDCSELVPTVGEFLALPFREGAAIKDLVEGATFYASVKA